MKHLKKQPLAMLLALVIVLGGTFIGLNRSLGAEMQQAADQFHNGVFDPVQNRVLPSIFGQLEQRATASLRILSIGEHSHAEDHARDDNLNLAAKDLREARQTLITLFTSGSPRDLFAADQALELAAARYYALLHPLVRSAEGDDLQTLEAAYSTMQSAARVISESGYNEAIREFHGTVLGRFPTNFLMIFVFTDPPELFS